MLKVLSVPEYQTSESPPLRPFITRAVMGDEISSVTLRAHHPPAHLGSMQNSSPLPQGGHLSPSLDMGITPPRPPSPGPQRPPVSQLRRASVHVNHKVDVFDQLLDLFVPVFCIIRPVSSIRIEIESRDRIGH